MNDFQYSGTGTIKNASLCTQKEINKRSARPSPKKRVNYFDAPESEDSDAM